MPEKGNIYIYLVQILFVGCISYGFQLLQLNESSVWGAVAARYIVYLLIIKGSHQACLLCYNVMKTQQTPNWSQVFRNCKAYLTIFAACTATLLYLKQNILQTDFLLLFIGYLVTKYPEMESSTSTINYGTGMACSFFEGYLQHVIPSNGADMIGFEANATNFENKHGVVIPVKRLFIVITKSLYSPPDLKDFNKPNSRDKETMAYLEARQSLQDVKKDVAGVLKRSYRNSVYKICRVGAPPVSLVAECATPLHTLHCVMANRVLYEHLDNVDVQEVVRDFCSTLQQIIDKSPAHRNKCELVYFDDLDPNLNLADILLDKLRQLEPDFEKLRRS